MRKFIFVFVLLILFSVSGVAQNKRNSTPEPLPDDFKSNGCTMFPLSAYYDCCAEHDKAYFNGGSGKQRWEADGRLFKCVAAKKGFQHKFVAPVMWTGVRIFGGLSWGLGRRKLRNRQKNVSHEFSNQERRILILGM